jgi:hypothetical protein
LGDEAKAREYARKYLEENPVGFQAEGVRIFLALTGERPLSRDKVVDLLRSASTKGLFAGYNKMAFTTDANELAIKVATELVRRSESMDTGDSVLAVADLTFALAWRGHFRAAYTLLGNRPSNLFAALALLGGVPSDSAGVVFKELLTKPIWPPTRLPTALPWWAARRDTVALKKAMQQAFWGSRRARLENEGAYSRRLADASQAFLFLATGDTLAGILKLRSLVDTACPMCFLDRYFLAKLEVEAGRYEQSDELLSRELADPVILNTPMFIPWALLRGLEREQRGDQRRAREDFETVDRAWQNGDPEAQVFARLATRALQRVKR